jgi:hypothetical protein
VGVANPQDDSDRGSGPLRKHGWEALYWLIALGAFVAFFRARSELGGFTHPTPWQDEGSFLWQAIAIKESNSLFAPELNPNRHVFWMPPGYMVLSGLIFKVTGFSLAWARLLSGIYLSATVAVLALVLRGSRNRLVHAVLFGIFLQFPIMLLVSNTARMEPLVLLIGVCAFALAHCGKLVAALAAGVFAPLIHPNALFFLVGAAGVVLAERRTEFWRTARRWEWFALLVAAGCWLTYVVYVARHWGPFLSDMGFQLHWKRYEAAGEGGRLGRLLDVHTIIAAAILVLAFVHLRHDRKARALLGLAGSLLLITVITKGWLYEVYHALLYLVLSVLVIESMPAMLDRYSRFSGFAKRVFAKLATVLVAANAVFVLLPDPLLASSVASATLPPARGMPPYWVQEDRSVIERFLRGLESSPVPLQVQFTPAADALLFHDLRSNKIRFLQQTFYEGRADIVVSHESIWYPASLRRVYNLQMLKHGVAGPEVRWRELVRRHGTEVWRVSGR